MIQNIIGNEKISIEELRFIYKLILDGWSDSAIFNQYSTLADSGDLDFPLRMDEDFIINRRKEMEAASEVLKDAVKEIVEKLLPQGKDRHFAQIMEVSKVLLQGNLDTITVAENTNKLTNGIGRKNVQPSRYKFVGMNNIIIKLNKLELTEKLRRNVAKAQEQYGFSFIYDCYVPHLKAIMGEEMEAVGGFWPAIEIRPLNIIQAIKDIINSKNLPGTCSLCSDVNRLPPFIK